MAGWCDDRGRLARGVPAVQGGIVRMSSAFDVSKMDPSVPAPAMVVRVDPAADMVGHGRTLPLIGGRRNYVLDVVFDRGRQRVYADTPEDVVGVLIPGYGQITSALAAADQTGDVTRVQELSTAAQIARTDHAAQIRVELQKEINAAAQADGSWDTLSAEERFQCERCAAGDIPTGVEIEEDLPDVNGQMVTITRGIWEHPTVRLVIDAGNYGWFHPDNLPEPTGEMVSVHDDPEWGDIVTVTDFPENMVRLDSSGDEETYLDTLVRAGVVTLTVYDAYVEDATYLEAVRRGRGIIDMEGGFDPDEWVGYHPENAADAAAGHGHEDHDHAVVGEQ